MTTPAPVRRGAGGPRDLRATGERIEALLDALSASRARWRASGPRSWCASSSTCTAPGSSGCSRSSTSAGRPTTSCSTGWPPTTWSPSLLVVHGLHPDDVGTRVERALDGVRPYLGSHGGDVELLGVTDDGVVRLRLLGSCDGCPSSSVTLTLAVENAIQEAAPEVGRHRRGGVEARPPRTGGGAPPARTARRGIPASRPMTARPTAHEPTRGARPGLAHVLRADPAGPSAAARTEERCEMCAEPIGAEHPHVVDLESRALLCTCRACYLLFTDRGRRGWVPGGARPLPVPARRSPLRPGSGTSCRSRSAWRSSSATRCSAGSVAFYPSPAGATESRAAAGRLGRDASTANPALRLLAPDVEALLVRGPDGGRTEVASWCRSTPATSWSASCAGAGAGSTAGRRRAALLDGFFADLAARSRPAPGRRPDDRAGLRRSSTSAPEPYAAAPTLLLRLRVAETTGERCTPSRCGRQVRIEPQRRALRRRRASGAARPVRRRRGGRETLQPFLWTARLDHGPGLHRRRRGRPAGAVHLRLRGRGGQVPACARRRRGAAASCCSAAPCSPAARPASPSSRCPGTWRRATGCRCAVWRDMMDRYFPGSGWMRLHRDTLDALPATRPTAA